MSGHMFPCLIYEVFAINEDDVSITRVAAWLWFDEALRDLFGVEGWGCGIKTLSLLRPADSAPSQPHVSFPILPGTRQR
jgi:hypothetical protein